EARAPICLGSQSHSRPNRPHISSDIHQCQRARKQNQPVAPITRGAASQQHLHFSVRFQCLATRPAHRRGVFRFGEGAFTETARGAQEPISKKLRFFARTPLEPLLHWKNLSELSLGANDTPDVKERIFPQKPPKRINFLSALRSGVNQAESPANFSS
ncbi:hypothetical protein, partial [Rhodobacter sp. JA431]|uniref:hypothetical protein n=1 Tax=Rhodobacter sp. JA431 TaxID=570013 RepID=UPI001BB08EB1